MAGCGEGPDPKDAARRSEAERGRGPGLLCASALGAEGLEGGPGLHRAGSAGPRGVVAQLGPPGPRGPRGPDQEGCRVRKRAGQALRSEAASPEGGGGGRMESGGATGRCGSEEMGEGQDGRGLRRGLESAGGWVAQVRSLGVSLDIS